MNRNILALMFVASLCRAAEILPPDPAIGGSDKNHWSTVGEKHWDDARWNETDVGPFQFYGVNLPGGTVAKGLSIKLGDKNEASICYDTATMSVRAIWQGKFLKFDGARFGLLKWPTPEGEILYNAPNPSDWGASKVHYKGLMRHGKRVILDYSIDDTVVLESPWCETVDGVTSVTRLISVDTKNAKSVTCSLGNFPGWSERIEVPGDHVFHAILEKDDRIFAFFASGNSGKSIELRFEKSSKAVLTFHPCKELNIAKVHIWSGTKKDFEKAFKVLSQSTAPMSLGDLLTDGPKIWGAPLETKGVAGADKTPYVVDTITMPYANPSKSLMFLSGVDFFENGDAAVCSLHGDVWVVRGIDDKLDKLTWQHFASGLFQPIGMKIINDKVHVMCRDRLVILSDINKDGEADYYENFNDACKTSTGGHDYSAGLDTDTDGNFYHVDPNGLHRISKDGKNYETIATGWRNPVGLSVGPKGELTVAPQQGTWTPASMIAEVKLGGFYGHGGPKITPDRPVGYDPPLVYIPRPIDNSTGGQLWVNSDKWGPLNGQLLSCSFGMCSNQLILREKVNGVPQGAVVPLPWRLLSGSFRGRFNPRDGQLYVVGTNGWQTAAQRDGSFQRVRYTGAKFYTPIAIQSLANGIRITFNEALRREEAQDAENYQLEQWNYKYSKQYGSADYSVSEPDKVGHDAVALKSATLSADGRSVFLEIPGIRPVHQLRVKYNLNAADGARVKGELDSTIHNLPAQAGP